MSLTTIANWKETREQLHSAIQLVGRVRLIGMDEVPNSLHFGIIPTSYGATSGTTPNIKGELEFHYGSLDLIYRYDGMDIQKVSLKGQSQKSAYAELLEKLTGDGIHLDPNSNKITSDEPFTMTSEDGERYAEFCWSVFKILAEVKARHIGPQTPVMLWPHGFDISSLWFVDGMDEHKDPHINLGFSPGTPDHEQPYFYLYAWPLPDGFKDGLPSTMVWNDQWSTPGAMLPYEAFMNAGQSERFIIENLLQAHRVARGLLSQ